MKLVCIGEHTVDVDRLTPGGIVLDAGCRDFTFTKGVVKRGCRVVAVDADPTVEDPKLKGVIFLNRAIAHEPGVLNFVMSPDPQARHIGPESEGTPSVQAKALTI